ncbi:MAG TPA: hypothetical protein PKG95_06380 [Anaerolineaceae bacterium]|jgi:HAMP domain-containing protein|nr:hypothetical protein [Anaerolineaceae bacterium]
MLDLISLITLLSVLLLGLILWFHNSRQAEALRDMARAAENLYLTRLKDRRDARQRQPLAEEPLAWLARQAGGGLALSDVIARSSNPAWLNLRAGPGRRLVVSPLAPEELQRAVKPAAGRSRLGSAFEPLLGRPGQRRLRVVERSLQQTEWFDLEAAQVGRALGVDWGEVNRLWFYLITPTGG